MAKVHGFLEMWQGTQNLRATQKESRTQKKLMTAVGYISDTEEIVKASWSLSQPDGAAAFKLSERLRLPPALSAKDLSEGRTQSFNVGQIRRMIRHPVESDEDSAPRSILDTENWLNCNGNLDNPNDSDNDCAADNESYFEHNNGIEDPEYPEQQNVGAMPNVPGLVRPMHKSMRQAPNRLVTVNAIEMRRNIGVKKTLDRMRQWFTSFFMSLDQEFQLEMYYGQTVRSGLWISVDKQIHSRRNGSFREIHHF